MTNQLIGCIIPDPQPGELPSRYADRVGQCYLERCSSDYQKKNGLYLTPPETAEFMASLVKTRGKQVRVLDPSAGAGVLLCAASERLARYKRSPRTLELWAYEIDADLSICLGKVLEYLQDFLHQKDTTVSVTIKNEDFILSNANSLGLQESLFPEDQPESNFDLVVANPPYFKIPKCDPRAQVASAVVHGQPNIYGLFMAVGARLLSQRGEFVYITPRSFASGPYFQAFRSLFFKAVRPERVHIFESRKEAFRKDGVLQENIIIKARRDDAWSRKSQDYRMHVSTSLGVKDLDESTEKEFSLPFIIDLHSRDKVLRLPATDEETAVVRKVDSWPGTLHKYGLEISTGPVVPFRATQFVKNNANASEDDAPLIWMNNVHTMKVTWPNGSKKGEYIALAAKNTNLLVPDKNYVLLRRFSAKEEHRRLVAAPLLEGSLGASFVGLENHLNYIHKPSGALTEEMAWGLAALYSSRMLDTYFRVVSGNTQVSATELRSMPLPALASIIALGNEVKRLPPEGVGEFLASACERL